MAVIEMMDGEEITITQAQYDRINPILNDTSVSYVDVGTRSIRKNLIVQMKRENVNWIHKVTPGERAEEERRFKENVRLMGESDGTRL